MPMPVPAALQAFVQELIDSGAYEGLEEIIEDALWLLKDRADLHKLKYAELRKLIAVGIEQADRGQVAPLDMEAIKAKAGLRQQSSFLPSH